MPGKFQDRTFRNCRGRWIMLSQFSVEVDPRQRKQQSLSHFPVCPGSAEELLSEAAGMKAMQSLRASAIPGHNFFNVI